MAAIKPLALYNGDVEGLSSGDFVPVIYGGTGASTKLLGFNNLSPNTIKGDLTGFDGTNNVSLSIGANNLALVADSTKALGFSWATVVNSVAGKTGAVSLSNTDIAGLGTMSTQNATAVSITGGSILNTAGDFGNATLLFKKSITAGFAPTAGTAVNQVDLGELYINALDEKIYTKNGVGTISSFTSDQKRVDPISLLVSPLLLDHSLKIASTEFVNFNQSRFSRFAGIGVAVNTTLTASDVGKWFQLQANSIVVTLPTLASVGDGKTFTFMSAATCSVAANGTEKITTLNGLVSSLAMIIGQSVTIVRNANTWYVTENSYDFSIIDSKANKGSNSDITSLNSLTYANLQAVVTGNFNVGFNLKLTDTTTASKLSSQVLRLDYQKSAGSTSVSTAFDSIINSTPTINETMTSLLYSINLEGPVVATGKTLSNYVALNISDPTGTVTSKKAIVTNAGSGNILFGTTTDNGVHRLQVNGGIYSNGAIESNNSMSITGVSTGVELGSLTTANTPYVDFHSSGFNQDYDSRIIAGGGNNVSGNGYIDYIATGGHNFKGASRITSGSTTDGLTIDNSENVFAAAKFSGIRFVGTDSLFAKKDIGFLRFNPYDGDFNSSYLSFYARFNNAVVEPMRIYGSKNVVIGDDLNDIAGYKLQVKGLVYASAGNTTGSDVYALENNSTANVLTKNAGIKFIGRDTVNQTKDTAYIRATPIDSNWVGSYLAFITRGSDAFVENVRMYGSGRSVIGALADDGVSKLNVGGDLLVNGKSTSTGNVVISSVNTGLEIGSLTVAGTPYIDFHSSGVNNDYDARIHSSGGTTNQTATLNYLAAKHLFTGTTTFVNQVLFPEGTASVPGISFVNDGTPDTGFYHISDGVFSATNNAQPTLVFRPTGVELLGVTIVPTATQFDVSTKIANMSAVYATGAHFKNEGGVGVNTAITLTTASAGNWFEVQANVIVTLPTLASVGAGITVYTFKALSDFTLKGNGTDNINTSVSSNTLRVMSGQTLEVVANGNAWYVTSNSIEHRSLGNYSGNIAYSASVTLTSSQFGSIVRLFGTTASQTVTFPLANIGLVGYSLALVNISTQDWTINCPATNTFQYGSSGSSSTTFKLISGATAEFVSDGGTVWCIVAGTALNQYTQLILPEGTAAAPSLTFANDGTANTGLYHNSDDVFSAAAGGTTIQTWSVPGSRLFGTTTLNRVAASSVFGAIGGADGSRIFLEKPATSTALLGRVVFDIFSSAVRFYDEGTGNKGVYIDLSSAATGANSQVYHTGMFDSNTKANVTGAVFINTMYNSSNATTGYDGLSLENTSTASNVTKFSGIQFLGRDTFNAQKQVAFIRVNPADVNYVGSSLSILARSGDVINEVARFYGSGNVSIGSNVDNGFNKLQITGTQKITSDSLSGLEVQSSSGNGPSIKLTHTLSQSKYIRVNSGNLEVVNSAYSAVIFTVQDTGVLTIFNNITLISNGSIDVGSSNVGIRRLFMDYTDSATNGDVTINKAAGKVRILAGVSTLTVTNNLVTQQTIILVTINGGNSTGVVLKEVIPNTGSFTINLSAAPPAIMAISFLIVNTN